MTTEELDALERLHAAATAETDSMERLKAREALSDLAWHHLPALLAMARASQDQKGREILRANGYWLVLHQCIKCDAIFPSTHAPDCPLLPPATAQRGPA
jgi:hypothetical protein